VSGSRQPAARLRHDRNAASRRSESTPSLPPSGEPSSQDRQPQNVILFQFEFAHGVQSRRHPADSRGVAQPGRAPGSGPGGRRFKSSLPDQYFQADKQHSWIFVYTAVGNFEAEESSEFNNPWYGDIYNTQHFRHLREVRRGTQVGSGYHTDEQAVGYYNTGDRMKYWGKVGAFWGGFWGLLFGSAIFIIPGLGPILAAGPVVAWIVAGLEDAVEVGALGALGAGLFSIGIPKDSIVKYEEALKSDQFLVLAHGTAEEVATARKIIENTHPLYCTLHTAEAVAA
jgi:hypothetical protein